MISISDNEISQYYKNLVLPSWKDYEVRHFEAITPKDLHKYDYLNFGLKHRLKGKVKVEFTETETLSGTVIWNVGVGKKRTYHCGRT